MKKAVYPKRGEFVAVYWLDTTLLAPEYRGIPAEECKGYEPTKCLSVGILMWADKDKITISGFVHDYEVYKDMSCRDITTFPVGMVQKVVRLKEVKS